MKHCLVIDDSRVIRKVARSILETMRFTVEEAEDGVAALALCRERMPEIILVDEDMPHMSGVEFLRVLRTQDRGSKPVVLYCTTENNVAQIREALKAGASDYVMKPFDHKTLEAKLAQAGLLSASEE